MQIVDVGAVEDAAEAELGELSLRDVIELALAMEAAIGTVRGVAGPLDLVRLDERVVSADVAGEPLGTFTFARGQAGADCGDADRAICELLVSDGEHERAVDP